MRPLVLCDEDPPDDPVILVRRGLLSPDSVHRTVEHCRREYGFLGMTPLASTGAPRHQDDRADHIGACGAARTIPDESALDYKHSFRDA